MRQQSKTEEALAYLEQIYDAYFPFTHGKLHHLDSEDFLAFLEENDHLETEHLSVLSDLFREEAEIWIAAGEFEKGKACLGKGIQLLEYLNQADPALYSFERMSNLTQWQRRLKGLYSN
ncbi:MAG: hypothetical protein AAF399_19295 [Bacteroidota bacterium]